MSLIFLNVMVLKDVRFANSVHFIIIMLLNYILKKGDSTSASSADK